LPPEVKEHSQPGTNGSSSHSNFPFSQVQFPRQNYDEIYSNLIHSTIHSASRYPIMGGLDGSTEAVWTV